ncbi:MAG TPA: 23S rRNA (guanosine(2251)-2'-O)-methyltransferase RlmB [Candidatus Saccharimonadia bacterium]|nr:23S rRNA (guanosine(2251)-2'-O)-methyltransferase RlmB [Candidatus Saccharimonadia bacterium]
MRRHDRPEARANKHVPVLSEIRFYDESDLADLLEASPNPPLVLVLDCVQDPHNFGACLRTADAAGVTLVVVPKDKSAPVSDTVRRVACGGAESVPIVRVTNLARAMDKLKELGVWLVGTADGAAKSIYQADLKGPTGIVMGAEGEGLRRLTGERCDFLVQIPMGGKVECLNVSVATGVCLFEAVRQRQ